MQVERQTERRGRGERRAVHTRVSEAACASVGALGVMGVALGLP